jgi:serine/threonine-protein kinase
MVQSVLAQSPGHAGRAAVLALALVAGSLPLPEVAGRQASSEQRDSEKRRVVETALKKAAEFMNQARWAEARAVLDQAAACLGKDGPDDLKRQVEQTRKDVELILRLEEIRIQKANLADGRFDAAGADRSYAAAFEELGLGKVGHDADRAAERLQASPRRAALVAALDDWAGCTPDAARRDWILTVARRADPDAGRNRARDPAVWKDRAALARLLKESVVAEWSPQLVTTLARQLPAAERTAVLRQSQRRHPEDFWVNLELANALQEARETPEAVGFYRAALALRPDAPAVYNNLGVALHAACPSDEAIAAFRRAIQLAPTFAPAHTNLGNVLRDTGRLAEAIACYQQALALAPQDARTHSQLATALRQVGRMDEAQAEYRKALALDPKDAGSHLGLGNLLQALGRPDEAQAEYRKAIELDPKNAMAHGALGRLLLDLGRNAEAEAATRRALELLPPSDPLRPRLKQQLERCRPQRETGQTPPA